MGENYANWAVYMQPVLYEARCFPHVFPTNARLARPVPPVGLPIPPRLVTDIARWDSHDQAGVAAITANVHFGQFPYLRGFNQTTATLWDRFESLYRVQDGQHRGMASLRWQMARQEKKMSLTKHLDRMMELRMHLREANVAQDDQGELVQLVNSCDRVRYGATLENVLTWLTWPAPAPGNLVQFSWPNVMAALRQRDAMDEVLKLPGGGDQTGGTQALYTKSLSGKRQQQQQHQQQQKRDGGSSSSFRTPFRKGGQSTPYSRGNNKSSSQRNRSAAGRAQQTDRCHWCQRKGHWEDDCRVRIAGGARVPIVTCTVCKMIGHTADRCYYGARAQAAPALTSTPTSTTPTSARFSLTLHDEGTERGLVLFVGEPQSVGGREWLVDSGCSSHITHDRTMLQDYQPIEPKKVMWGREDQYTMATGKGTVYGKLLLDGEGSTEVRLADVLYVPGFGVNLVSVKTLARDGVRVLFGSEGCEFLGPSGESFGTAPTTPGGHDLYVLRMEVQPHVNFTEKANYVSASDPLSFHRRASHVGSLACKMLNPSFTVSELAEIRSCINCMAGKQTRRSYGARNQSVRAKRPGEIISMDTCDLGKASISGFDTWLVMVDEKSKYLKIVPMKGKSGTVQAIKEYVACCTAQGTPIAKLRSDNGGEFINKELESWCREKGIIHLLPTPYTPQQNGMAERANRTVLNGVRTLLFDSGLAPRFWAEAANAFVYTMNLIPSVENNLETPFEMFCKNSPPPMLPYPFGESVRFWVPLLRRAKLSTPGLPGRFLGPGIQGHMESPGSYRIWDDAVKRVRTVSDLAPGPVLPNVRADGTVESQKSIFEMGSLSPSDPPVLSLPYGVDDDIPGTSDATRGEGVSTRGIFSGAYLPVGGQSEDGTAGYGGTSRQVPGSPLRGNPDASQLSQEGGTPGRYPSSFQSPRNLGGARGSEPRMQFGSPVTSPRPTRPEVGSPVRSGSFVGGSPSFGRRDGSQVVSSGRRLGDGGSLTDLLNSQEPSVTVAPVVPTILKTSILFSDEQSKRKVTLDSLQQQLDFLRGDSKATTWTNHKKVRFSTPHSNTQLSDAEERSYAFPAIMAYPATDDENPLTVAEARSRVDWPQWESAMKTELDKMLELKVWDVVERPTGRNIIKCKWVFVRKEKADGTLNKYKARLVARGFTQEHGIDYSDTFAPTVQLTTVRVLLAYAAANNWEIHQIDVVAAYLHAGLDAELYMEVPDGYEVLGDPRITGGKGHGFVVQLLRALYGLKQSARQWNHRIVAFMVKLGFKQLHSDSSCFVRGVDDTFIAIVLHVDDQNILSPSLPLILELKKLLATEFGISDEGETQYFLGLQVFRDRAARRLKLSQPKYTSIVLKRFNQHNYVPVSTPLSPDSSTLHRGQGPDTEEERRHMEQFPYRAVVGSLMYLMVGTRPDLAYPLGRLSAFLENPGVVHWEAAIRVLRYVRGTADLGLIYGGENVQQTSFAFSSLTTSSFRFTPSSESSRSFVASTSRHATLPLPTGWCDASFAEDITDRKSTGGHVFILYGAAVSWRSKKQSSVARSTVEAEYVECSEASSEALFLSMLIGELGLGELGGPVVITVHSDSQGALALVQNPINRHRTKHIDIHFHFVRDLITKGLVKFQFVGTEKQTADYMTKVVTRDKLRLCAGNSGLGD